MAHIVFLFSASLVLLTFLLIFTSAPLDNKYLSIFTWPFWAAMKRGVAPSTIWAWISAPLASSSSTTSRWLHWHATNRGVPPSYKNKEKYNSQEIFEDRFLVFIMRISYRVISKQISLLSNEFNPHRIPYIWGLVLVKLSKCIF